MFKKEIFAKRLKDLRTMHLISMSTLASNIGLKSKGAINQFEKNLNLPSIDTLVAIADYFCVSLDFLAGRSDNPRYEDFVNSAEIKLLNEAEEFIKLGINAEVNSKNELIGSVGKFMKNFYTSHKSKYTAPLAHLRLIFGTRELANQHLNPKTIKINLVTPEPFRTATLRNPKEFLKEMGILPQEVQYIEPLKADEKNFVQLLIEELDKIEEEYTNSNPVPKTEK